MLRRNRKKYVKENNHSLTDISPPGLPGAGTARLADLSSPLEAAGESSGSSASPAWTASGVRFISYLDRYLLTQAFTDILWATETPSMNWSFTLKIQIFCCPCQRTMPWGCGMLRKAVDWDCKNNLRFDNLLYSKKARKTRIFLVSLHYRSKLPLIMIRYSYNSQSAASLRLSTTSQYSEELRDTGTRSSVQTLTWMEPGSFPVGWITVSRCGGWTQKIYRLDNIALEDLN